MITLLQLNNLDSDLAAIELRQCCGSERWVQAMLKQRPFFSKDILFAVADEIWYNLSPKDWREAFSHHPKIGDLESLKTKFATNHNWAHSEQSAVHNAHNSILESLKAGNDEYERRFGYIFIVCATGKSAQYMLSLLHERLTNDPDVEIKIAMNEQAKITRLRLEKLLA